MPNIPNFFSIGIDSSKFQSITTLIVIFIRDVIRIVTTMTPKYLMTLNTIFSVLTLDCLVVDT